MAEKYFVVLREGQITSSDAAIGTKPTEKSKVLGPAVNAKVVNIEAENVAEAQRAAFSAYPGITATPVVVTEAQYKES